MKGAVKVSERKGKRSGCLEVLGVDEAAGAAGLALPRAEVLWLWTLEIEDAGDRDVGCCTYWTL